METPSSSWTGPAPLASATAGSGQRRVAVVLCLLALVASLALLPIAALPAPAFPGFVLMHQTALIVVLGASAWVLYAQFRRARSLPLLLAASGTLYTTLIVLLQLLSYPGVFGPEPVLGAGSPTTLWFWTFWHLGPPTAALAYALALAAKPAPVPHARIAVAAIAGGLCAVLAAAASLVVATRLLPWLPAQTVGPSYWPMVTSGIGPAVQLLTIAATLVLWRATRGRQSVLELWIAVSLVLLILDNFLTYTGAARGTVGWMAGRGLALISGFAILWAYLIDVDALHGRAEAAAEERARAEAALRQAQKMEAIGQLTGGVAHDFNNLLQVIHGNVELLRERTRDELADPLGAELRRFADLALRGAERGAALTQRLLAFSRQQALIPEPVDPNQLVAGTSELIQRTLGEQIGIGTVLAGGVWPIFVDANQLENALLNLAVNARDAMPAGGRLTIETANARLDAAAVESHDVAPGDYVTIKVSDTGAGISPDVVDKVFDPFFTTKPVGQGSGLGLSQVYGFVRQSNGFVTLVSALGAGTSVTIHLPRSTQAQPGARQPTGQAMPRGAADTVVLVVEDDPDVRSLSVGMIARLGYTVFEAADGAAALDILHARGDVALLFTDIGLPGHQDGRALATSAQRRYPGLKVLFTTGYAHDTIVHDGRLDPDVTLLTKPFSFAALAAKISEILSR